MQHSRTESYTGVIDTGDLVVVKKASVKEEITSYVAGRGSGYSTYGEYGDVIVYKKQGKAGTPVIHRALVWVQWNDATKGWDVPELKGLTPGQDWSRSGGTAGSFSDFKGGAANHKLTLNFVGYARRNISIEFGWLNEGRTGFLTLGDNAVSNPRIDQAPNTGISDKEPVRYPDWVIGVARGELPCFGLVKLYVGSAADKDHFNRAPDGQKWCALGMVVAIIAIPLAYDVVKEQVRRRKVERGELGEDEELEGPVKKLYKLIRRKLKKGDEDGQRRRRRRGRRRELEKKVE